MKLLVGGQYCYVFYCIGADYSFTLPGFIPGGYISFEYSLGTVSIDGVGSWYEAQEKVSAGDCASLEPAGMCYYY